MNVKFQDLIFQALPTCLLLYLHEECHSVELKGWESEKQRLVVVLPSCLQNAVDSILSQLENYPCELNYALYFNVCRYAHFVVITAICSVLECN